MKKVFRQVLWWPFLAALVLVLAIPANALVLKMDLNCDGIVNLDDYSLQVARKNVDYQRTKDEFGKSGDSDSSNCPNTGTGGTGGTTTPTTTPTPTPTPTPTTTPTPEAASVNLTDSSLVAYFSMNEASGGLKNRASTGAAANLYPKGSPTYGQTGRIGKGIRVKGDNGYFCSGSLSGCADAAPYKFAGSFTLGMWVKFDDTAVLNKLFRKWEVGEGSYVFDIVQNSFVGSISHPWPDWLGAYDSGQFRGVPKGRSYQWSLLTMPASAWHHLVVVRDSSGRIFNFFLDGQQVILTIGQTVQSDGRPAISVMRADNQEASVDPFKLGELSGIIDDFFAYNKALTASEIQAIYAKGAAAN